MDRMKKHDLDRVLRFRKAWPQDMRRDDEVLSDLNHDKKLKKRINKSIINSIKHGGKENES